MSQPRDSSPLPRLTSGELAVLRLLAGGHTERQAAAELHYSYAHVRRLAAAACERLGAGSTRQACYLAGRLRLF